MAEYHNHPVLFFNPAFQNFAGVFALYPWLPNLDMYCTILYGPVMDVDSATQVSSVGDIVLPIVGVLTTSTYRLTLPPIQEMAAAPRWFGQARIASRSLKWLLHLP